MNPKLAAALCLPAALGATLLAVLGGRDAGPADLAPEARADADAEPASRAGDAAVRTPASARLGLYWAPVGSRFTYALRTRTEMASTAHDSDQGARTETQVLATSGHMVVEVVARLGREAVVAFACPDLLPELPSGTAPRGELAADFDALRARNLARVDVDGRILAYRFADGLTMPQRDYVRGLFGGFGFVVPPDAGAAWTANGCDSTGEFEARYERTAEDDGTVEVVRTKLRYVAQRDAEAMPATVEGAARATLDASALGWLANARVDDVTKIAATIAPVEFRVTYHATLELERAGQDAAVAIDDAFDGTWSDAGGHSEDPTETLAARDRAAWAARLDGQSVASLTAAMEALLAAGQSDSRELVELWSAAAWLLRLQPETVAEVARALAAADVDPKLASLWLSALADAGSDAAQSAVLAAWSDTGRPADVRGAAAAAMFDVREPSPALVQGVAARVDALESVDAVDATAVLALGALAQRAPDAMAGDRTALAAVEGWRTRAVRLGAEDLWLDALGNARSTRLEDAARDALNDERLHVREAGVRALGRVDGARAFATLCHLASEDPAPELRREALAQLAVRPEAAARGVLLTAAETDPDATVRQAALIALARRGVTPGDRVRLEAIAHSERDETVREIAQRMLQG